MTRTAISPRFAIRIFDSTALLAARVRRWERRILRAMRRSAGRCLESPADRAPAPATVEVRRFASIDSTNRYLLDEARAGAPEGVVAVADHQDAGRGRLGRTWERAAGLVAPGLGARFAPGDRRPSGCMLVTMAAGLALAEARRAGRRGRASRSSGRTTSSSATASSPGSSPRPIWQRDGPRRPGTPVVARGRRGLQRAVGRLPARARGDRRPRATSKPAARSTATTCSTRTSTGSARHYGALDAGSPPTYRARLATVGRRVRVELGGTRRSWATAVGVDDAGRLLVEADGGTRHDLAAGDVVHLRPGT